MNMPWMNQNKTYTRYKIGRGTYGSPKVEDWGNCAMLEVGSFCSFSRNVTIFLSGEHHTDWVSSHPVFEYVNPTAYFQHEYNHNHAKGNVTIGSDVWIGFDVTILSGVTIGHGAIIGAGSVVSRNVPPYTIAAGNPVRQIRGRFDHCGVEGVYERLLAVAWWNWPDEKIREFLPLLMSDRIGEFLEKAEA